MDSVYTELYRHIGVKVRAWPGLSLFSIPRADGRLCTILSWNEPPEFLTRSDEEIQARIAEAMARF